MEAMHPQRTMPERQDIVITGIGIVSSIGIGRDNFWQNCRIAKSGIQPVGNDVLPGSFKSPIAAVVRNFNPRGTLQPTVYRRMSRLSRMTAVACMEAVQDSGVNLEECDKSRFALITGTAHGSSASIESFYTSFLKEGPRGAQPSYFPETVPNAPAGNVAMILGLTGPSTTFGQNDISAENALVYALHLLSANQVDMALVCGMDELNPMFFGCFDDLRALNPGTTDSNGVIVPKMKAGIVLGEGAGALLLEQADSAFKRRAAIYASIGTGVIQGAVTTIGGYDNSQTTMHKTIELALDRSGLSPGEIDQFCISANFSGFPERIESQAILEICNPEQKRSGFTPLRYLTGSLGGGGIFSAAALACGIKYNQSLPILSADAMNRMGPPPPWQLHPEINLKNGLLTACTYGGGCACIVFSRTRR